MNRFKRAGVNAVVLVTALLIAVGLGEFMVRTVAPQTTMFPRYVESTDYPIDFPPNAQLVHSQGRRWRFVYTTNGLGRRGPDVPVRDSYDSNNVVVLGDSFTFGFGVRDDEVYTQVLADRLGPDYAVINGGTSGWGIDSEIKWYDAVGREYQPQFVVLQFTANDPSDDVGVTSIENGEFVFHPYPSAKPWWQRFLSQSGFIQRSHLYALARKALDRATGATPAPASASEAQQRHYASKLELFAQQLHERSVQLLFVSVTAESADGSEYGYDVDRFPVIQRAVRELAAGGLLSVVALPLVEMSEQPGSAEGHQWGPRHHEMVGTRLAEEIQHGSAGS